MGVAKYSIPPFSKKYHDQKHHGINPCCICGKEVTNPNPIMAIVINGGGEWGDENSPVDGGHMGAFPVGPDCHRRYKLDD
jgi:hypothetical protein